MLPLEFRLLESSSNDVVLQRLLFLSLLFGNFFIKLPKKLITGVIRIESEMNRCTWRCKRTTRFPSSDLLIKIVPNHEPFFSLLFSMSTVFQGLSKCFSNSGKFSFKQTNIGTWRWRIIHLDNHGIRSIFSINIKIDSFNDRIHMMWEEFGEGQQHHKWKSAIRHSIKLPFTCTNHVERSFLRETSAVQGLITSPNFMWTASTGGFSLSSRPK